MSEAEYREWMNRVEDRVEEVLLEELLPPQQ
jgi:hypothetical protein